MSDASPQGSRPRAPRWEGLVWAVMWCLVRCALLVSLCDVFGYGEEFEKACAGKALLDGVPLPLHLLPYHPYEGGGFTISVLDALSFAAFGESVFAMKIPALVLGAAILWVGWCLCDSFAGRTSARLFAALYVFAPESVQVNSLLSLGIHYQACLFIALALFFACRATIHRDAKPGIWLALGLSLGFGLYFSYQLVLTVVVIAGLMVVALRRDLLRAPLVWAAVGLLLGATPLLWMYAQTGAAVFDIHGAKLTGGGPPKLATLSAFVRSLFTDRAVWDSAALVLLVLTPLAAAVSWRRIESRSLRWVIGFVGAHVLVFLAAYLASGFTVGSVYLNFLLHRLTPLWFLVILGVALAASRARHLRWMSFALIALGAFDTVRLVRDAAPSTPLENLTALLETKGYRYSQYLQKIEPRIEGTRVEKLLRLRAFREDPPQRLHSGLAIALYGSGEGSFESMSDEMRSVGFEDLTGFYRGMGLMLMRHQGREFVPRVNAVLPFPPEIRDPLLEGIGSFGQSWEFGTEDTVLDEARFAVDAGLPEALIVGLGRRLHEAVGDTRIKRYFERRKGPVALDRSRLEGLLEQAPPAARDALRRGYELEAAAAKVTR